MNLFLSQAQNTLIFDDDWSTFGNLSTNDLALSSSAYYWAAAAVQLLRADASQQDTATLDSIKGALAMAQQMVTHEKYSILIELYNTVVKGTEELV